MAKSQPLSTEPHIDYSGPSTRAKASGRGPSLGMGSRGKGSLRGVALSGAQRSRRETKWVPRALPGGTHSQVPALARLWRVYPPLEGPIKGFMWTPYLPVRDRTCLRATHRQAQTGTRRTSSHEPRNRDAAWTVFSAFFRSKRRLSVTLGAPSPVQSWRAIPARNAFVHRNTLVPNMMYQVLPDIQRYNHLYSISLKASSYHPRILWMVSGFSIKLTILMDEEQRGQQRGATFAPRSNPPHQARSVRLSSPQQFVFALESSAYSDRYGN
jgi:hypothetical protein